jgi:hypothetical protein
MTAEVVRVCDRPLWSNDCGITPKNIRTGGLRTTCNVKRGSPDNAVRRDTQKRLVVEVIHALVLHSVVEFPGRVRGALLAPAPERTAWLGVDKRREAGQSADTVVGEIGAIWAATYGLGGVSCMPRRGCDVLFKLEQVPLFLGTRAAVVRRRACRWWRSWRWRSKREGDMRN